MEKLNFDNGVKEYRINGNGILRFNPGDPNLYARFLDALDGIKALEQELMGKAQAMEKADPTHSGEAVLRLMQESDRRIKALLTQVFGSENDFEQVLGGVNLLATAGNGQRVIANFLTALQPVLEAGANTYVKEKTAAAVAQAKRSRAQRAGKE